MEPNQNQTQPQKPPEQPTVPVAPTEPEGTLGGGSNKIWIILVIIAAVIAVAVAGYMFMSRKQVSTPAPAQRTTQADNLETELNAVQLEDVDSDFVEMDKDIQSL